MTYLVIENKNTKKRKFFTTRQQTIEWIKRENPDIPTRVINSWRVENIINEYIKDWFVVIRDE